MDNKKYAISDVTNSIKEFFAKEDLSFTPILVVPESNHPDDTHLFGVVAESTIHPGTYAAWTCWNAATNDLNYGHYDLTDIHDALSVIQEYYHDVRASSREQHIQDIMNEFKNLPHIDQFYCIAGIEFGFEWKNLSNEAKQLVYERYMDTDEISLLSEDVIDLIYTAEDYAEEVRHTPLSPSQEAELIAPEILDLQQHGFKEDLSSYNARPEYSHLFYGPSMSVVVADDEDLTPIDIYPQIIRCPESDECPASWEVCLVLYDGNDYVSADGTWPDSFKTVEECFNRIDEYMKDGGLLEKKIGKFVEITDFADALNLETEAQDMSASKGELSETIDESNSQNREGR